MLRFLFFVASVTLPLSLLPADGRTDDRIGSLTSRQVIPQDSHRSPVDVVLSPDESWLLTANQSSGSVSLVRVGEGRVADELLVGDRPTSLVLCPDGRTAIVSCAYSGQLVLFSADGQRLQRQAAIDLGEETFGVVADRAGRMAYVALPEAGQVAVVDLADRQVTARVDVGRWPRHLALSPDGASLAVATSGDGGVSVVDVTNRKLLYQEKFTGLNIGQLEISADGRDVVFPWIIYRRNPITAANIRLGWVLASRIGRVRMDGPARREAVSLDPRGEAIADPYGLALTHDQQRIVMTASGTHELLLYHAPDLPFQDWGGTDTVPASLLADRDRFDRIPLGGRPLTVRISRDDRLAYVANYLDDSVQVVDLVGRRVVRRLYLGGPEQPSLARQGEAIFYDGRRSLDQWYSCHSCHYEGGTLPVSTDTRNDGKEATFKTVLPLYNVTKTSPWTWHGWQTDFADAMRKSLTQTLLGPEPSDEDVAALTAYLETLKSPPNFRARTLDAAAERGQRLFQGDRAGCATCHNGPYFTDGQIHDLGFSKSDDPYQGFNTPSLIGVSRKTLWFHDGRCKSLEDVLTGPHRPADVAGTDELTAEEVADLVAYLKTL